MTENIWRTSQVISKESYAAVLERYRSNWLPSGLRCFEKQVYSENGEDGIFEKLFSEIGSGGKYFVEFGARDGFLFSITRYLREQFQWSGLLMDGGNENVDVNLQQEFITAENINQLFTKYNVPNEFDLLSIDIDGNDFWVWKAIDATFSPRVVVIETNQLVGPEEDRTIVYNASHRWSGSCYFGAGILSIYKLGRAKGYSLAAAVNNNALFIRNDLLPQVGIEIPFVNDVERLYQPRIPRNYMNQETGDIVEYSKEEVEAMATAGECPPPELEPMIERCLFGVDAEDGYWTTSGL